MRPIDAPSERQRRRSIRLRGYDYAQAGAYFVTIVTQGRACLFGDESGDEVRLSAAGEVMRQLWQELPDRFPGIGIDEFIVMPNHIHGIITIAQPLEAQTQPDGAPNQSVGASTQSVWASTEPVGAPLVGAQGAGSMELEPRASTRVAPTGDRKSVTGDCADGEDGVKGRKRPCALGDMIGAYKSIATVAYVRGVKGRGWPQFSGKLWQRNYYEHVVRREDSLARIRQYIRDNPARWEFDRENPLAARQAGKSF